MSEMPTATVNSGVIVSIQPPKIMATIGDDGRVRIDWAEVERRAAENNDRYLGAVAKALLAVRDNKWEPIK